MRTLLSCALLVTFSCPLAADDKKDEKIDAAKLVGKWQRKDQEGGIAELTKDGKAIMHHKVNDKELKVEGTYKVDGNKLTVKITFEGEVEESVKTIKKITDTEMVLVGDTGKEVTMVRVKDK